jgi:hypothetical protein
MHDSVWALGDRCCCTSGGQCASTVCNYHEWQCQGNALYDPYTYASTSAPYSSAYLAQPPSHHDQDRSHGSKHENQPGYDSSPQQQPGAVTCPSVCMTEHMRISCEPCRVGGHCPSECYQCSGCGENHAPPGHGSDPQGSGSYSVPYYSADHHDLGSQRYPYDSAGSPPSEGCPTVCTTEDMRLTCTPCGEGGLCPDECHQCAGCNEQQFSSGSMDYVLPE